MIVQLKDRPEWSELLALKTIGINKIRSKY
jgi:hypothetical protein